MQGITAKEKLEVAEAIRLHGLPEEDARILCGLESVATMRTWCVLYDRAVERLDIIKATREDYLPVEDACEMCGIESPQVIEAWLDAYDRDGLAGLMMEDGIPDSSTTNAPSSDRVADGQPSVSSVMTSVTETLATLSTTLAEEFALNEGRSKQAAPGSSSRTARDGLVIDMHRAVIAGLLTGVLGKVAFVLAAVALGVFVAVLVRQSSLPANKGRDSDIGNLRLAGDGDCRAIRNDAPASRRVSIDEARRIVADLNRGRTSSSASCTKDSAALGTSASASHERADVCSILVERLIAAVRSKDGESLEILLNEIAAGGNIAIHVLKELMAGCSAGDDLREFAGLALVRIGTEESVQALLDVINLMPPGAGRDNLIRILEAVKSKDAARILVEALSTSSDENVVAAVEKALTSTGGEMVARELLRLVREETSSDVAWRVDGVLRSLNDEEAIGVMTEALGFQHDPATGGRVATALARIGSKEAVSSLLEVVREHPGTAGSAAACLALSEVRMKQCVPLLLAALREDDPAVREAAALAVRNFPEQHVLVALQDAAAVETSPRTLRAIQNAIQEVQKKMAQAASHLPQSSY